jgi:hypothetical protein
VRKGKEVKDEGRRMKDERGDCHTERTQCRRFAKYAKLAMTWQAEIALTGEHCLH